MELVKLNRFLGLIIFFKFPLQSPDEPRIGGHHAIGGAITSRALKSETRQKISEFKEGNTIYQ